VDVTCSEKRERRGNTADFEGCLEFEEDGLIDENFSSLCAEKPDFVLCQLDLFAWSAPSD
jgi:hypothetical protein